MTLIGGPKTLGSERQESCITMVRPQDWVARQRPPRPTLELRQGCTCWVPTGGHGTLKLKLSLSPQKLSIKALSAIGTLISSFAPQKGGLHSAEVVTQSGTSVHLGLSCTGLSCCHLGSEFAAAGTLSCNPALGEFSSYDLDKMAQTR